MIYHSLKIVYKLLWVFIIVVQRSLTNPVLTNRFVFVRAWISSITSRKANIGGVVGS